LKSLTYIVLLWLVAVSTSVADFTLTLPTPVRVIDGDTLAVTLDNIPAPLNKISVRLLGIDTPELRGKCVREKELALAAKKFTTAFVRKHPILIATKLRWDKYGGRVDGVVTTPEGESLSDLLVAQGLAKSYRGQGLKTNWCLP
jgi:micrococcal nuclease